ncbi:MAG: hypothetical protein IPP28_06545 [Xanthomonadales bacterium]|nr:hypothetical protein [Xanthomonadales bacterium]
MATKVGWVSPPSGLALMYHWLPLPLLDVSVTLPPRQNVVGPLGVIVGAAGMTIGTLRLPQIELPPGSVMNTLRPTLPLLPAV